MRSFFHSREDDGAPVMEPVPTVFPKIEGADVAAVFVGKRMAGDFYDSIRVSPERILIGLLDVAGRREDNRKLLASSQAIFRTVGTEIFSAPDINEADAMTELSLRINRALIENAERVLSCPAFVACYHEKFGTLCYTNAGHTPALLRDSTGVSELGSTGLPLGLFSHATAEARIVGMEKGAMLLSCPGGVVTCEGRNNSRSERSSDSITSKISLREPSADSAETLCKGVLTAVAEFSEGGSSLRRPHCARSFYAYA